MPRVASVLPGAPAPLEEGKLPKADAMTLGVLGGGQLGRMFVHAAQRMGFGLAHPVDLPDIHRADDMAALG